MNLFGCTIRMSQCNWRRKVLWKEKMQKQTNDAWRYEEEAMKARNSKRMCMWTT